MRVSVGVGIKCGVVLLGWRVLAVFVAVALLLALAAGTAEATSQTGDYDTDDDGFIEVSNLEQLNAIRWDLDGDGSPDDAAHGTAYPEAIAGMGCPASGCLGYELVANLDFDTNGNGEPDEGDAYWNNGAGWLPIKGEGFSATFDGNGHTISNLYIARWSGTGLFAITESRSVINRIGLVSVNVAGSAYGSGGALVGDNNGAINDSYSSGEVRGCFDYIGGLVGTNAGSITDSYTTGGVFSWRDDCYTDGGGLVGQNTGTITDSHSTSIVSGYDDSFGGLVGANRGGVITHSYATGDVSGNGYADIGGLAGNNDATGSIIATYATGTVSGNGDNFGGLVGRNSGSIGDSHATGDVSGNGYADIGGLAGNNDATGSIIATYATGTVSGNGDNFGGLVGRSSGSIVASYATGTVSGNRGSDGSGLVDSFDRDGSGVISNSYWDIQTSGQTSSDGGIGKTTQELQSPTDYTGIYSEWNVDLNGDGSNDDPWDFGTSSQYPVLIVDHLIVGVPAVCCARDTAKDFNTLRAAGNEWPSGLWSDGTTLWVTDSSDDKLYAYNLSTKARDPDNDFNTLDVAGNNRPRGIWSDGTTLWVTDWSDDKLYAYNLSTKARDPDNDFNTLQAAGNRYPYDLWSDGTTLWVTDLEDDKLYAYNMPSTVTASGPYARDPAKEYTLQAAGNNQPRGLWSDGTTLWVTDWSDDKLYAYNLSTKARDPNNDFNTLQAAGNDAAIGLWSDGTTLWVTDWEDEKLYAYNLSTKARDPNNDFNTLQAAGNRYPYDLWSDGTTLWVADPQDDKLYAYNLSTKARDPSNDFNTLQAAGNNQPIVIWSDGTTMWVMDEEDDKIYAYHMPARAKPAAKAQALIGLPEKTQLQPNAPNPFNSETVLSYFLLEPGPARLEVFSMIGQRVAVLRQGHQQAGYHRLRWNGRDDVGRPLASGIYLYRLMTAEGILTRKLTLLR